MNIRRIAHALAIGALLAFAAQTQASVSSSDKSIYVEIGGSAQVQPQQNSTSVKWGSSDPSIAEVFQNGYVVGLKSGTATIRGDDERWTVIVKETPQPQVNSKTLKQYSDSREFQVNGRKCFGSELNGQRAVGKEEEQFTDSNRVINPHPLGDQEKTQKLEWEVAPDSPVYDGAGYLIGTVKPKRHVGDHGGDHLVPVSMFNFGMSKILGGKLCLYAFSVTVKPDKQIERILDPDSAKADSVETSAWLPLEDVVDKETLLTRIGLGVGEVHLPRLPLDTKTYRITGGNDQEYQTPQGEMGIVKTVDGPVPSHYLRRPSGTVNIIYSVPGFGLGGQGLDSFLVTDNMIFHPAKGAKVFVQPTYFPAKSPRAKQVTGKTMTFIYGAVEVKGNPPVYGWIAKEALSE